MTTMMTNDPTALADGVFCARGSGVNPVESRPPAEARVRDNVRRSSHRIPKQSVAEVTAQLAIMTRSGVDIASSLASLASQCRRPELAEVLDEVRESVLAGSALSEAMRLHADVFDPTFIATVAAGEASGRMSEVLEQLAQVQRNAIRSARVIRSLMTYPVLLMAVSSVVLAVLVLVVLPKFTQIFAQYDMALPVVTKMLLFVADEITTRWWLWLPVTAATIGSFLLWRATKAGRQMLDYFWLHGPVVGEICQSLYVGRSCRLIGLMLKNGVPLLDSVRLTRQAISNSLYVRLLHDMETAVVNGQGLADVLHHTEIIPESAREMIATAEKTGKLGEVTAMLGQYYDEEAEAKTRQVVGLLEPMITVVMGAIIAMIVLAVMLPVFDLSTVSSGGR